MPGENCSVPEWRKIFPGKTPLANTSSCIKASSRNDISACVRALELCVGAFVAMNFKRSSGILLHPTSLPGPYGIGDLGPQAYRFIDWLSFSGCKLWQVLPLGPTGYGDSPYQCFSAFAGNPYLISPDELIADGLLTQEDLNGMPDFSAPPSTPLRVNFGLLIPWKLDLLQKAFSRFQSSPEHLRESFDYFHAENAAWLDDFTLFMALKEAHGGGAWNG